MWVARSDEAGVMNIFVVDESPVQAARDLCNKHVVKMIVESAQILSTVQHLRTSEKIESIYKRTHVGHPAVSWTKLSSHNEDWLWQHLLGLLDEYTTRYGRRHKTTDVVSVLQQRRQSGDWRLHTPFVQCMPEKYRQPNAVSAYRAYYVGEKAKFARWLPRAQPPSWWPVIQST